MRTHVFLDIDGVLVMEPTPPLPPGRRSADVRVADGRFVPVSWDDGVIADLGARLSHPDTTVTTVSTWEHDAPALFRTLGLPEVLWLTLPEVPIDYSNSPQIMERKRAAVSAHLTSAAADDTIPDRILWIDDHHSKDPETRAALAAEVSAEAGPDTSTLILAPWARECLTAAHLDEIRAFLG
ncbi:HAD domain-containing protein [Brevibacterium litoralis]|uniref:HAD domain-containing protein n=1 Tax=Brevibacterium litoralis TaxID=3138935 RepID=UPI0032EE73A0